MASIISSTYDSYWSLVSSVKVLMHNLSLSGFEVDIDDRSDITMEFCTFLREGDGQGSNSLSGRELTELTLLSQSKAR